jgi:hypothetical protein
MGSKFRHAILNDKTLSGLQRAIPEEPLPIDEIIKTVKCGDPSAKEQFQRLFFCYRLPSAADYLCLNIFLEAIAEQRLNLIAEFISVSPQTNDLLENVRGIRGRTVESGEHKGMKIWARDFLVFKGIPAVEEVSMLGYRVDVGCLKKNVFVECGDTEPKKIFDFLWNHYLIGILQYNSEYIVWFEPKASFTTGTKKQVYDFMGCPTGTYDISTDQYLQAK